MALHTRICCDNLAKRVQASLLVVHPFANDGDADDAKDIDGAHGLANTATHVEDSVAGPGLNTDEDACNGDVGVGEAKGIATKERKKKNIYVFKKLI